jgi:hypothetical protein
MAAYWGHREIVRVLLAAGADAGLRAVVSAVAPLCARAQHVCVTPPPLALRVHVYGIQVDGTERYDGHLLPWLAGPLGAVCTRARPNHQDGEWKGKRASDLAQDWKTRWLISWKRISGACALVQV